jgi:hypothetical protein
MRNTQRFMAMAGVALAAGTVLGVGAAASAAPGADSGTTAAQPRPSGTGNPHTWPGGGNPHIPGGTGNPHSTPTGSPSGSPSNSPTGTPTRPGGGHTWPGAGGNHNWPGGMGNSGGGRWHGTFDGHRRNRNWVQSWAVDTFRSKKACNWVGWIGEKRNLWDDSDCYRIGRGRYILIAHEYGRWHRR